MERGFGHKHTVLTLVDRAGEARSFHVEDATVKTILPILDKNIAHEAKIASDEAGQYLAMKRIFPTLETVNHMARAISACSSGA